MEDLLIVIDDITKYGLKPDVDTELDVYERVKMLEKSLVKIYCMYFEIKYEFDETEYPDFEGPVPLEVSKNINSKQECYPGRLILLV